MNGKSKTCTDGEVFPNLLKQIHRSILEVSGDSAYNTRACHTAIRLVFIIDEAHRSTMSGGKENKEGMLLTVKKCSLKHFTLVLLAAYS